MIYGAYTGQCRLVNEMFQNILHYVHFPTTFSVYIALRWQVSKQSVVHYTLLSDMELRVDTEQNNLST